MFQQKDKRDCGLYVFKFFLYKYFNEDIDINTLKRNIEYEKGGISLFKLIKLYKENNFDTQTFNCSNEELLKINNDEFPLAVIVNRNNLKHMVLIEKIKDNNVYYFDPEYGTEMKIETEKFLENFDNLILKLSKIQIEYKLKQDNTLVFSKHKFVISFKLIFLYLLQFITSFIPALFSKYVLQILIPEKLKNELFIISMFFLIIFIICSLIQVFIIRIFENKLLNSYINKTNSILISWVDENIKIINNLSDIEIKNRLNSVYQIINYQNTVIAKTFINIFSLVISFLIIFFINKKLIFVVLIFSFIALVFSLFFLTWYKKNKNKLFHISMNYDSNLSDWVNILKSNYENSFMNKNKKEIITNQNKLIQSSSLFNINLSLFNEFESFLDFIFPFLILVYGAILVWNKSLNVYDLLFFITASNLFLKPLKSVPEMIKEHKDYVVNLELLNLFKSQRKSEEIINWNEEIKKIQLSYVSFSYSENQNFKVINIPRLILEDKIILTGKNGSGKTTLCNLLTGKYLNDFGEILVNDKVVKIFNQNQIKDRIYYIGDKKENLNMTCLEYLMIQDKLNFKNTLNKFGLIEIMKELNLNNLNEIKINQLSSGQLQFIKLLRILLIDYDFIIFDEAFESLTNNIYNKLISIFQNILKDKLVLEISHNQKYIFKNSKVINIETL
ncbi:cysteine peptidase family C39 domain-containing protein [Mycoplasmopsis felis]|uniref:Mbov_0121 family peptidase domain-containing ABC transporter n=1 Tax=Mycoplasmopsis felis TaxID=33923 RepID=UPI002AFDE577|nr:cysteine peptidase family C39 domain-containing protein [Mycoplasmopsis felis]WQQ04213.1 cysteine peptidase family C39 domain-containing protein [Mycoplasmopsis felis]